MRTSLALLVTLLIAPLASASDWPQWLGPNRDSISPETVKPWKEPLKILWKQPVGEGHGGPVVADGKVFLHMRPTGKNEEAIAVFDANSGKPEWTTTYPRKETKIPFGNGPRGCPTVDGGKVYTFGITGILTCSDAKNDKIHWQVDTAKEYKGPSLYFGVSCSPIVEGDHVLVNVGAKGASIVAFHKDSGKEVWKKLDDGASYSSPAAIGSGESRQVIFLTAKGLVSIAPKDGTIYWQRKLVDLISESSTTPVLVDDIVFASSITAGSIGVKLDSKATPPSIKDLWAKPLLTCYFATPVAHGKDTLYVVTGNNPLAFKKASAVLRCIDATTGDELWQRDKVGTYHASLLRTGDGKFLMVEEPGNLVLFDPSRKAYSELSRSKICGNTWAHPALANGRLYIRDAKELVCVELAK